VTDNPGSGSPPFLPGGVTQRRPVIGAGNDYRLAPFDTPARDGPLPGRPHSRLPSLTPLQNPETGGERVTAWLRIGRHFLADLAPRGSFTAIASSRIAFYFSARSPAAARPDGTSPLYPPRLTPSLPDLKVAFSSVTGAVFWCAVLASLLLTLVR